MDLVVTKCRILWRDEINKSTRLEKKDLVETKYARCTHVAKADGTLCKKKRLGSDKVCKMNTLGKCGSYNVYI